MGEALNGLKRNIMCGEDVYKRQGENNPVC